MVTRPGYEVGPAPVEAKVVDLRGKGAIDARMLEEQAPPRVFITDVVNVDVAATTIRSLARAGDIEGLKTMVTPTVADYIGKHRLYVN